MINKRLIINICALLFIKNVKAIIVDMVILSVGRFLFIVYECVTVSNLFAMVESLGGQSTFQVMKGIDLERFSALLWAT